MFHLFFNEGRWIRTCAKNELWTWPSFFNMKSCCFLYLIFSVFGKNRTGNGFLGGCKNNLKYGDENSDFFCSENCENMESIGKHYREVQSLKFSSLKFNWTQRSKNILTAQIVVKYFHQHLHQDHKEEYVGLLRWIWKILDFLYGNFSAYKRILKVN